ncbi:hypothetical protein CL176_03125 [Suicoccus acidiformans]|uniref:DUF1858 domain-containing protein n=1 Tax=Suicoccus acidiformans TaxID=2036206 RepID=A0A347WJ44_9LACT|nr:DUF1858 domain-containing protein [Suicoccus acidiformans]AXY25101.1 hypothetical protein CL176_03125 [Suicoccus acidiformans]
MNEVDLDIPVADVLDNQPELLDLLVNIGFKPLANPIMRQSVGKVVSLRRGAKMIGIPMTQLVKELIWNGYIVKGADVDAE